MTCAAHAVVYILQINWLTSCSESRISLLKWSLGGGSMIISLSYGRSYVCNQQDTHDNIQVTELSEARIFGRTAS